MRPPMVVPEVADSTLQQEVQEEAKWRGIVSKAVAEWAEREWREKVLGNGILKRTYAALRRVRGTEMAAYLKCNEDPIGRKWWSRLRSGVHGLAVHVGRFSGVEYEGRLCEHCRDWDGCSI